MKYKKVQLLPSELHNFNTSTNSRLFEDRWEIDVVRYLEKNPGCSVNQMLTHLIAKKPELYNQAMLRSLQRRVKEWRTSNKSQKVDPIQFIDLPGATCVVDLIAPPIKITIRYQPVQGVLFLYYLPFSGWVYLMPIRNRYMTTLVEAVQDALWLFGRKPKYAINMIKQHPKRLAKMPSIAGNNLFNQLCQHYMFQDLKNIKWPPDANLNREKILQAFRVKFKSGHKTINFNSFEDYHSEVTAIMTELNGKLDPDKIHEEKTNSRQLPSEGFVNSYSTSGSKDR
ncbi:MAG: hypothetical protein HOB84_03615 [Candidatus Marinimicrobia bacterium]|nr:hypothetical protein [Candidatus Neomarinimicrobiota bacterium]MBT4713840.1 hypothetical protein [Candidatus Neomarinimicrobiota bacterium]